MFTRKSKKSIILKGGEKMRTLGLVLALTVIACSASFATAETFDVYGGWQTVSLPVVPFNPTPNAVFSVLDWDNGNPTLMRWNNVGGGGFITYGYDYDTGIDPIFGGCLLGDGYLLNPDASGTTSISVDGVLSGVPDAAGKMTDMWISLPKAGFALVGVPYAEDLAIDQDTGYPMAFTDGVTVKTWPEAVAANWVGEAAQRYDAVVGRWITAGINYYEEESWQAGKGYLMEVKQDNIAMIITAPDAAL